MVEGSDRGEGVGQGRGREGGQRGAAWGSAGLGEGSGVRKRRCSSAGRAQELFSQLKCWERRYPPGCGQVQQGSLGEGRDQEFG